jgi:uncharacterized protein (DUF2249 family)
MSLLITPQTKVGDLLAAYPALEEVLVAQSPHFAKLRNPILRRTVGKVATLQAAAVTGGVDVSQLVRVLREAAGQDTNDIAATSAPAAVGPRPSWVETTPIAAELDVDRLLNTGEHPLQRIVAALREAGAGKAVRLTSTFRPEPLIEKLTADGYRVHADAVGDGWVTFIGG